VEPEIPGQGQLFKRDCFQPKEAPSFRPEAIHSVRIDEERLLIERRAEKKKIVEKKLLRDWKKAIEEDRLRETWDEAIEEDKLRALGLLAIGEEQLTPEEQDATLIHAFDEQRIISRMAIVQTLF
jgi:hypothetical protein